MLLIRFEACFPDLHHHVPAFSHFELLQSACVQEVDAAHDAEVALGVLLVLMLCLRGREGQTEEFS